METWLPIPGWPNYEVSNLGRVRNINGRVLKPMRRSHHYLVVDLHRGDEMRREYIHRLVLQAFVGPCPAGHETSHINDVSTDNRLVNLRWATHAHNISNRRHSRGQSHSAATQRGWSTRRSVSAQLN